ncbi:vacuolar transport protein 4A [Trypanosoma grayi]|uniref:vacuolar transport protein 4A n=1 Tax=Trypanosoma grayi TaxID=71804 RepID=UPI0004F4AA8C|nr:vacuolar transport protein 4A [Trypanosoma grayi]KEG15313.1 vacuolar transport protein 4A [Trypanosoma grayi]
MAASLSPRKVDEALLLASEARDLLLRYGHSRKASVTSLVRIQETLRAILQCTSLMQAYDTTPYHCGIYNHVSRTFLSVLDLQLEDSPSSGPVRCSQDATEVLTCSVPCTIVGSDGEGVGDAELPPPDGGSITTSTSSVRWADIVGCEDAIAALKQATILPLQFPHLFQGPRRFSRRILLYGPPGTGKTLLAAAAATGYGAPLLTISSADILSKWIGESERQVRRVFDAATRPPRCILFLDEVDAICSVRGAAGESEASRRVKTELLLRMQSLNSDRITIIAATNMPWELDSAFRRRFDHLIFVGLPSPSARRQLFALELQHVSHTLSDEDVEWLVNSTEGYSASDIRHVAQHAAMEPVHQITQTEYVKPVPAAGVAATERTDGICYISCSEADENALPLHSIPAAELHVPKVCRRDFETALRGFPPTVSNEEMLKFTHWRSREGRSVA